MAEVTTGFVSRLLQFARNFQSLASHLFHLTS
jgi:hypothetical protein